MALSAVIPSKGCGSAQPLCQKQRNHFFSCPGASVYLRQAVAAAVSHLPEALATSVLPETHTALCRWACG